MQKGLYGYLIVVNLAAFLAFAADKRKAVRGKWRIRESTLLALALAGGSVGGILAMYICRHKIRKPVFAYGLPVVLFLQIMLLFCLRRLF